MRGYLFALSLMGAMVRGSPPSSDSRRLQSPWDLCAIKRFRSVSRFLAPNGPNRDSWHLRMHMKRRPI